MKQCKFHGQIICGCNQSMVRCKCRGVVPVSRIECIHNLSHEELFEQLVFNAAASTVEHPARMMWACQRIAKARGIKVDDVFKEIRATIKERTGTDRLPGEALNIRLN